MKYLFWNGLVLVALSLPVSGLAAKHTALPLASASSCESHAVARYQRRALEIEMSVITGSKSEFEVGSERASLQERLHVEKDDCRRMARKSASVHAL